MNNSIRLFNEIAFSNEIYDIDKVYDLYSSMGEDYKRKLPSGVPRSSLLKILVKDFVHSHDKEAFHHMVRIYCGLDCVERYFESFPHKVVADIRFLNSVITCNEGEFNPYGGLCNNVSCPIEVFFYTWEHFSGCREYPVPSGFSISSLEAYQELPHWTGKQLEYRKSLARHIMFLMTDLFNEFNSIIGRQL